MTRTILANAQLILPGTVTLGAITLQDGVIVAIQPGSAIPPGALDMQGDFLAHGMVERAEGERLRATRAGFFVLDAVVADLAA